MAINVTITETDTPPISVTISDGVGPRGATGATGSDAEVTNTNVNAAIESNLPATVSSLGASATGGEGVITKTGADESFRTTPTNPDSGTEPAPLIISNQQRIYFEDTVSGSYGGAVYLFADHALSGGVAGSVDEIVWSAGRFAFYWSDGLQFGPAVTTRGTHFIYLRNLGTPDAGDPARESVPLWFDGQFWNGSEIEYSKMGIQWLPTGDQTGELVFGISGFTYSNSNSGSVKTLSGVVLPFSITEDGPKVGTGKVLTFGDGSTMASAPDMQARTGNVTLVAGTATVADTSVTSKTNIILQRRGASGTIGDITYTVSNGVSFTITSASATDTSRISYYLVESLVEALAPTISGNNWVGETLTVVTGGGGGGYEWYADAVAISGETGSTYVIDPDDIGKDITCAEGGVQSEAITAWSPADETGYLADYRGGIGYYQTVGGSAATLHGDPVGQWQDQSGNDYHVSNATAGERPLLDLTTDAGFPHLDFDGTDDWLSRSVTLSRPQTAFIVAEANSLTSNKRYFGTGPSGDRMIVAQVPTADVSNDGATTTGNQLPAGQRSIITARTTDTLNAVRVDAGTEVTATETTGNGNAISIGGTFSIATADCRIHAVLFYEGDLDTDAQTRVRAYLKAQYSTP